MTYTEKDIESLIYFINANIEHKKEELGELNPYIIGLECSVPIIYSWQSSLRNRKGK